MDHALTTTAFTLDGHRITRNLGVVRGIMVRSKSIFGTIGGSLQTIVGGNISLFTSLCEKTRNEAFELMLEHARQLGANAVVGIRYDVPEQCKSATAGKSPRVRRLRPAMNRTIIAIGGGGFLMEDRPSPVDSLIAKSAARDRPRICFISTPSGDSVDSIDRFYSTFELLGCRPAHLAFFRKPMRTSLPLAKFAEALLSQHAIFVGGGNTKSALAVWREWKLDRVLAEAWRRGIVLSGVSAGAMCWFEQGLTDSYWGAGLKPLSCLGLLPGGCAVHYSSEPQRRIRLHEEVAGGVSGPRIAIDDGAAVVYSHTKPLEVVSWRDGATAYHVALQEGEVMERPSAARRIA